MLAPGVDPLAAAAQAARGAIDQARRLALQDPCVFLAAVLQDEVTGQTFRPAPIHEEWQDLCTQHDRLVLWAPIAHGKSSGISIGRVLYELAKNPSLRVGICTNTGGHNSLGVKILSTIKQYVEKSPRLRAVAPHLRPSEPWTQTSITVERPLISKDPTVQVFGIGGDILGARLDLLIFDDILDWEAVRTKAARDAVTAWLESTVLGRLADGSRVWAVGNPWDPDDSYHRLAKKPGWHSQVFRATHADGSPTWAERWTMESLARKRQDLGPREAARQLDCRARSDESSRFQSAWVEQCLKRGDGKTMVRALQRVPPGARVLVGVDLAVQEKDEADETSLMAVLVHPNRDREVLCIESGRWGGPVIVDKIVDFHQRYLGIFFVENNAAQDYILQFARLRAAIPMHPYTTGRTKAHPEFGVERIAAEMAAAKWIIPNVGGACHPEVEQFVNDCLFYTPTAHTGDRLMAGFFVVEGERILDGLPGPAQVGKFSLNR